MHRNCLRCFRPIQHCLCSYLEKKDPSFKIVILMHPREAYKQRTGTGRLASLSLEDSEIIIDQSFNENKRFLELVNNPEYHPMVLYPGENSINAAGLVSTGIPEDRKLLVFAVDATWILARKMIRTSSKLMELPSLSFTAPYRSRFYIKKQPAEYCLSTIESIYYLIAEFQDAGLTDPGLSFQGLMDVFDELNRFQLDCKTKKTPR